MEAELRKLRIDRDPRSAASPRKIGRMVTMAVATVALMSLVLLAYSHVAAPTEVEVYRVPLAGAKGAGLRSGDKVRVKGKP